jgi:cytochrome P450
MIRRTVDEVLAAVPADEPVDAVECLASEIPIAVIAEMFGVGDADRAVFRRWSDAIIASPDQADAAASAPEVGQMAEFLIAHIDSAATEGNDLLEILKGAELDGRPLNSIEIMGFCLTLLVAGNETTRTLLSGGMEELARCPDQRRDLALDLSQVPTAIEELLRWVTPIQAFGRTAVVDVEVGGQEIPAGDFLVMLYASGNRDEAAFGPTAGRFDVHRPVTPTHVAFGFGEHLCLGASLARLEARIFFEALLSRYPTYEVVGEPEYVPSTVVRGASRLPVVLAP